MLEQIGYDYGIKPHMMVVGDVDFSNMLREANIIGLGYIKIPMNALTKENIEIALMFEHAKKGKELMRRFQSWIDSSNGNQDAFSLDIIENSDGGYTLCFYQGTDCLIERNIPNTIKRWVRPLLVNMTHFKKIDFRSNNYNQFKKALNFSKCYIYGGDKYEIFQDINPLERKKISIYTEGNIPEDSFLKAYNSNNTSSNIKKCVVEDKNKLNQKLIEDEADSRRESLQYFYPITFSKINSGLYCASIIEVLTKDYDKMIIYQAICNLNLKHRLKDSNMKIKDNNDIEILTYLLNNYESMKSIFLEDTSITMQDVKDQISFDEKSRSLHLGGE